VIANLLGLIKFYEISCAGGKSDAPRQQSKGKVGQGGYCSRS
jgi:hypothetical protein